MKLFFCEETFRRLKENSWRATDARNLAPKRLPHTGRKLGRSTQERAFRWASFCSKRENFFLVVLLSRIVHTPLPKAANKMQLFSPACTQRRGRRTVLAIPLAAMSAQRLGVELSYLVYWTTSESVRRCLPFQAAVFPFIRTMWVLFRVYTMQWPAMPSQCVLQTGSGMCVSLSRFLRRSLTQSLT